MPATHLVQGAQRGQGTVGGEHRIGDHDGALLGPADQRGLDGADVVVRGYHHPRPGQPTGVHQRRVAVGVGHDQRAGARQRRHRGDVGGIAGREHQRRLGAHECGQLGLEVLVQFGIAGHQTRSAGARTPGVQRRHAALDDGGMLRQAEIVVGRQVQFGGHRGPDPQRPAQARGSALAFDISEPGQRRVLGHRRAPDSRAIERCSG
ncbi:Uncharacterised protein [Mycobacteroides abscessus subsp. abscessus]|nr:Uncharacterised protein [Mycobacteroides abscessus subsp. abscessus]